MIIDSGEYDKDLFDIIVIGGGPAGLTAGIYARRALLKTLLIERMAPGGKVSTTHLIENYPGFPEGIGGAELSSLLYRQAQRFGLLVKTDNVVKVERDGRLFLVSGEDGEYLTKTIIVSTGTREKGLGVRGEEEFRGRGVSYCATCDGLFFRGKDVAVVGGGDTAIKEALFLARLVRSVTIIHRREGFRAEPIVIESARANPSILWKLNRIVLEIRGKNKVESVIIKNLLNEEVEEIKVDGVFIFIGQVTESEFLGGLVKRDKDGFIITDEGLMTHTPGIFAAGDVRANRLKQVVVAAAEGALAFHSANEYLKEWF